MNDRDAQTLKENDNRIVRIKMYDGESMIAKVQLAVADLSLGPPRAYPMGGATVARDRHCREGAFNTSHFGAMLLYRLGGGPDGASFLASTMSMDPFVKLTPVAFLVSSGLWMGLAAAGAILAVAVWLRCFQGPIE